MTSISNNERNKTKEKKQKERKKEREREKQKEGRQIKGNRNIWIAASYDCEIKQLAHLHTLVAFVGSRSSSGGSQVLPVKYCRPIAHIG